MKWTDKRVEGTTFVNVPPGGVFMYKGAPIMRLTMTYHGWNCVNLHTAALFSVGSRDIVGLVAHELVIT